MNYKTITCTIATIFTFVSLASCGQSKTGTESGKESAAATGKKALVCYFSATGTTADAAKRVAELTGGTLHEITPEKPYSDADLDWRDSLSRCYVEMHDFSIRPAVTDSLPDLSGYDVICLGYPNWWNTCPTVINTFIENNQDKLKGKTILPFMTSGGGDIEQSISDLRKNYPELTFGAGLLMNDATDTQITDWINSK